MLIFDTVIQNQATKWLATNCQIQEPKKKRVSEVVMIGGCQYRNSLFLSIVKRLSNHQLIRMRHKLINEVSQENVILAYVDSVAVNQPTHPVWSGVTLFADKSMLHCLLISLHTLSDQVLHCLLISQCYTVCW